MESNVGYFTAIVSFFKTGGFWMFPIFVAQVVSLAIIAERVVRLFIQRQPNLSDQAKSFEADIKKGNLDRVLLQARSLVPGNPLRNLIESGVQAAQNMGGREEIQAKMDEVLVKENSKVETRVEFLAMLGNVGTLLGLLGTIVGMIRSFASISVADQMTKAALLSAGVSEAMHATAYGLIMAIPAIVMYSVLQNRVNKISEDMTQAGLRIFNLLGFHYESIPVKKTRKTAATSK
ncbi:MotA/TolQ/ExbB proton channel family protein [bacterium]|nr:MotA/TolQ/ExbB proton channel family protein [bacterium]